MDEAQLFADIARDLASQTSEQAVLDRVVELALRWVPGCDDAGLMVLTRDQGIETPAATSDRVRDSDQSQATLGEGPCIDAAREQQDRNQVYRCDDTATDPRWESYLPRARELGVGSMLGFQLFHDEWTFGALNLYGDARGGFSRESEQRGWLLASHAAVALNSARTDEQMREALGNARVIGQALGMVRQRYGLTEEAAVAALKRLSQESNTKLHVIARSVVAEGDLPEGLSP